MRYVPKGEKAAWQQRAMVAADEADLGDFISLCVKTKEWDRLARRVHSAKPAELEALSHYCTEPAAKGLAKRDALAAAKLYRALGLRIVNAGKASITARPWSISGMLATCIARPDSLGMAVPVARCGWPIRENRAFFQLSKRLYPANSTMHPLMPRRPRQGGSGSHRKACEALSSDSLGGGAHQSLRPFRSAFGQDCR